MCLRYILVSSSRRRCSKHTILPHDAADIKGRMQYFDMGYKHIFHHSTQPNFDAIANIAAAGIYIRV